MALANRAAVAASRACLAALTLPALVLSGEVPAQMLVGDGQEFTYSAGAQFNSVTMNGGRIRFADFTTGAGFTVDFYDATFLRGDIASVYTQGTPHIVTLNNQTTIEVGTSTAPFPANGMSFSALSSEDSASLVLRNFGTVNQLGGNPIELRGRVAIDNTVFATYLLNGDSGINGTDPARSLLRNSGTLAKVNGAGISNIAVRVEQNGGKVEAWSGELKLNGGGAHDNSRFFADALGTNPGGAIAFGGNHVFTGSTLTETGNIKVLAGATVGVDSGTWTQKAFVDVAGTIVIAPGATLSNQGSMATTGTGALTGNASGATTGTFRNENGAHFQGSLTGEAFGPANRLEVVNAGHFVVGPGDTVQSRRFINTAGILTVDGVLDNQGGVLEMRGGYLGGGGVINGDAFFGGFAGEARFTPGHSPGTMTINGTLTMLQNSVLELEIERDPLTGLIIHDRVIANAFSLDGKVLFKVGADVTESDVTGLSFLDCGGGPCVSFGEHFSVEFGGRSGSQVELSEFGMRITTLAPVPEPGALAMLCAGLVLIGVAVRRRHIALATPRVARAVRGPRHSSILGAPSRSRS
jgi:hypothetical protein